MQWTTKNFTLNVSREIVRLKIVSKLKLNPPIVEEIDDPSGDLSFLSIRLIDLRLAFLWLLASFDYKIVHG